MGVGGGYTCGGQSTIYDLQRLGVSLYHMVPGVQTEVSILVAITFSYWATYNPAPPIGLSAFKL